mgnify:FL=1
MNAEPKFQTYLVDYPHEGAFWSLEIKATSFEDAEARVRQLQYAKVAGELKFTLPAGCGFIARAWCWLMWKWPE